MIYRVIIDFDKLLRAAEEITDLPKKEERLKSLHKYLDKEVLINAASMEEAITKVKNVFDAEPYQIEETNFTVIL